MALKRLEVHRGNTEFLGVNKVIEKFSSSFKDYLRAEGPKHFGRKLTRRTRCHSEPKSCKPRSRFAIEVEDIGEAFNSFIYESIDANSLALFYGGKY